MTEIYPKKMSSRYCRFVLKKVKIGYVTLVEVLPLQEEMYCYTKFEKPVRQTIQLAKENISKIPKTTETTYILFYTGRNVHKLVAACVNQINFPGLICKKYRDSNTEVMAS